MVIPSCPTCSQDLSSELCSHLLILFSWYRNDIESFRGPQRSFWVILYNPLIFPISGNDTSIHLLPYYKTRHYRDSYFLPSFVPSWLLLYFPFILLLTRRRQGAFGAGRQERMMGQEAGLADLVIAGRICGKLSKEGKGGVHRQFLCQKLPWDSCVSDGEGPATTARTGNGHWWQSWKITPTPTVQQKEAHSTNSEEDSHHKSHVVSKFRSLWWWSQPLSSDEMNSVFALVLSLFILFRICCK